MAEQPGEYKIGFLRAAFAFIPLVGIQLANFKYTYGSLEDLKGIPSLDVCKEVLETEGGKSKVRRATSRKPLWNMRRQDAVVGETKIKVSFAEVMLFSLTDSHPTSNINQAFNSYISEAEKGIKRSQRVYYTLLIAAGLSVVGLFSKNQIVLSVSYLLLPTAVVIGAYARSHVASLNRYISDLDFTRQLYFDTLHPIAIKKKLPRGLSEDNYVEPVDIGFLESLRLLLVRLLRISN